MSRSFLSRPQPLPSRLRPRAYASNHDGDSPAEATPKRHLYVVLDDHKDGYGIHKPDLGDHHVDLDGGSGARRLPEVPVRVALETVGWRAQLAGVGRNIVATGATRHINRRFPHDGANVGVLVVYDTETAAMAVTPDLPPAGLAEGGHPQGSRGRLGNRLYMLESASQQAWSSCELNGSGNVHCLARDRGGDSDGGGWSSWKALSYRSRWSWSDDCGKPLALPFWARYVTAHAPAQHEHEILVSVRPAYDMAGRWLDAGTFSFSTASRKWTRRTDWQLPAHGHAHYDGVLGAWLGLHAIHDGGGDKEKQGFCKDDDDDDVCHQYQRLAMDKECLLRLTAFHVERGHDGELGAQLALTECPDTIGILMLKPSGCNAQCGRL